VNGTQKLAGGLVAALIVVAAAVWLLVLNRDNPDEVSLDDAQAAASADDPDTSGDEPGGSDGDTTDAGSIEGAWSVDTSIGEFDFESASGSFAGFRVNEVLTVGEVEAVGRTGAVNGSFTIAGNTVDGVQIEADLAQLTTNDTRRNKAVGRALDVAQFPTATFVLTEPIELPTDAEAGVAVSAVARGEMTIHGTTLPVEFPIEASFNEGVVAMIGSTPVTFADYGIDLPSAPIVVSISPEGTIEFQLLFTKGPPG